MKLSLSLALSATLLLSGCSVFQRSPTWDLVVRGNTSGGDVTEGKGGYIDRLHQILAGAGVEHKVVTYQYHWLNAYREEAMQAGILIIYRDDSTPSNPWWITDQYRHTPVWVPNTNIEEQVGFFLQQRAEVVSVKEYGARVPSGKQIATISRRNDRAFAETRPGRAYRSLFADGQAPRLSIGKPKKTAPSRSRKLRVADPISAPTLLGSQTQAVEFFRSKHGTAFDPNSSTDRQKMNELRRRLLTRNQVVGLRTE